MHIGIIGGGASGMAAAIEAAKKESIQVTVIERQARVGRKLQATGNGRCNLTNLNAQAGGYFGDYPQFARPALEAYSVEQTLEWFRSLGLYTVAEESGRVYPYSDQANSVVDVLRFALNRNNIRLLSGMEVTSVKKVDGKFRVDTGGEVLTFDRVIVACGGLAGSKLGGSMSGYKLLRGLGHHCTRLRPSLVQLKSGWNGCVSLKGVRANCHVKLMRDGSLFAESIGELQFTEYGLSGPVIFEISRDACSDSASWSCQLDFFPDMDRKMLLEELELRRHRSIPVEELLTGILHNRLGRVLTAAAGIRMSGNADALTLSQLEAVADAVKSFEICLNGTMGMDHAQVTAGGILTEEFDPATMESRLVPGLYACGEVLDIDGACGGYNLQWAWSSGRLAGQSAGGDGL